MQALKLFFAFAFLSVGIISCTEDDVDPIPSDEATFKVTIENVLPVKDYLSSGTTDLIMPGESYDYSFHAGKGMYLSLATMFVASNDLFFGFEDVGLALYDADGSPVTGDVTGAIELWDAGTEVNEEPGNGANQPANQTGPNTGDDESGLVHINADGFTYPANSDLIELTLAHDGGTGFTLTVANISDGTGIPNPYAPGVWVVHGSGTPIFTADVAASAGLEALAEDGNNMTTDEELKASSGYSSPFAPGVYTLTDGAVDALFEEGAADRGEGLEALAEDGDPSGFANSLDGKSGIAKSGVFNTPVGSSDAGPLMPGASYSFTLDARVGDYLSFATMLVQTNDLFYAFDGKGYPLFSNGNPASGDVTSAVSLWDAGTEVNEYPGAGNNQPVRGGGDSGPAENGNVQLVNDGFTYPTVSGAIKVTLTVE